MKTFGASGNVAEFGQIGSDTLGSPVNTKDPATIQALASYLSGMFSITASGTQAPRLEDLNSLFYLITHQFAYLMQAGVPEWHVDQDYYIGGMARVGSKVYIAQTGDDITPNVGNNPETDAINWKNFLDAANLTGTLSLDRLPTNLTGKKASTAGLADSATVLQTPRNIGGVSFNGGSDINLPGVNQAGNQNTSGKAATAGYADSAGSATYATSAGSAPANGGTSAACSGNAATATYATSAGSAGSASSSGDSSALGGIAAINFGVMIPVSIINNTGGIYNLPAIPGSSGTLALYIIVTQDTNGDSDTFGLRTPSGHGFSSVVGEYTNNWDLSNAPTIRRQQKLAVSGSFGANAALFNYVGNWTSATTHYLLATKA